MDTRKFALIWGIGFILVAASGLASRPASGTGPERSRPCRGGNARWALGLFPVNILHNAVHLIFGIWGIGTSKLWDAAKTYAKSVAIIYVVFVVMGMLAEPINTTFGLVPLHGNDVWLHLLLAAPAAYFGFMHRDDRTGHRA